MTPDNGVEMGIKSTAASLSDIIRGKPGKEGPLGGKMFVVIYEWIKSWGQQQQEKTNI